MSRAESATLWFKGVGIGDPFEQDQAGNAAAGSPADYRLAPLPEILADPRGSGSIVIPGGFP
ncbi:hypothetical protein ACFYLX_13880 [Pseudarthrobacter enclensis]|uniref:hypothetical protein n=1 Tax=Pseudarthrobacter enclensis TaxID=993070 RepID=UPI0014703B96|nr:hypothetical protein [Pseudarthrobacter enclensis]